MSKSILTSAFTALRVQLRHRASGWFSTPDDVEDALQDTFVRLWPYAERLDTENDVKAMAITTLRNIGVDQSRRASAHPPELSLDERIQQDGVDAFFSEDPLEDSDRQNFAREVIRNTLSPLQQKILQMREYEELDYNTIAARLHMQPAAVRMQLSRARKTLRETWRNFK